MGLDRQDIERRDFPVARRGYEPKAVDAHLRRIADEVEERNRGAAERPSPATLATASSEQVRAIVEAAETTAGDIKGQAEDEAAQARSRAQSDADRTRADANEQARRHVAAVQDATQVMLQRVDAIESELGALVESLRTGANRLSDDLTQLEGNMGELRAAATAGGADEGAEVAVEEARAAVLPEAGGPEPELETEAAGVAEPERIEREAQEPEPAAETPAGGDDSEGARLIALNMALNGTSREETDRYLADNFQLEDRDKLLDEVYARVG